MEEKIAELIFNNCIINKDIDETFIKKIIEIVIKEWNIKEYTGSLAVEELDKKEASYNCYRKLVTINSKFLNDKNELYFPNDYNICSKYLIILQAILHELIHAMHYNIQFPFYDDLEKLIIYSENKHRMEICKKESFTSLKTKYYMSLTRKYYKYSPTEKMAEIDSARVIKKISEILNNRNIMDIMELTIYYNYFRGYSFNNDKLIPPTPFYLSKIKSKKYIKQIKELGLYEDEYNKMRLGLDIDIDSFLGISEDLKKIYKKVKKRDLNI